MSRVLAFGVRTRQTKQAAKLLLDRIGLKNQHPSVTGVDQRIPHPRKGFRPQPLVSGQQPAPRSPGRVGLAAAPALGFANVRTLGQGCGLTLIRIRL
jgi:hypothetical protein